MKYVFVLALTLTLSACGPQSTSTPTNVPSSTPSAQATTNPSEPVEAPTEGLIEFLDFSEAPPENSEQAQDIGRSADRFGAADKAWSFNGGSSFYRVNRDINGEALPQITLSAWVRSTQLNPAESGHVISPDNANTSRILYLNPGADGSPAVWTAGTGPSSVFTKTVTATDQWTLLTVSYDDPAAKVAFYVNGELVDNSSELAPRSGYEYFHIGNSPFSGKFFEGDIDDVRIYNRVLSEQEVKQLYQATAP